MMRKVVIVAGVLAASAVVAQAATLDTLSLIHI